MKVYQVITDRIVEQLEKGVAPWRKPWGARWQWPRNLKSKSHYRGVNVFLLSLAEYESPYWLTFKQAKAMGGTVKKGEKGLPITFWTEYETNDKESGEPIKVPVLRYYTGFNVAQCEGIEAPPVNAAVRREFSPIKQCQRIADAYAANGPEVKHGHRKARYAPTLDLVEMPDGELFHSDEEYYSTLFHELVHSTGHKSRLARKGVADASGTFGDDPYAREELVAEMGAAFLAGHCGIEGATLDNSASYLAGWLAVIKGDPKLVIHAAAAAQKAADWILAAKLADPMVGGDPRPTVEPVVVVDKAPAAPQQLALF